MRAPTVLVALALALFAYPADALVLCAKKRGGAVSLREACKRKETAVPLDQVSVQARVSGTCPPGNAIRAVAADGTVGCEAIAVSALPTQLTQLQNRVATLEALLASVSLQDGAAFFSSSDVLPTFSCQLSTQFPAIGEGKPRSVLVVHVMVSNIKNGTILRLFAPTVNGFDMTGDFNIDSHSESTFDNSNLVGVWWLDIEEAEAMSPGTFLGQPLQLVLALCPALGGADPVAVTVVAQQVKK